MERDEIDWRFMRREPVGGLAFLLNDSVEAVSGPHRGATGSVVAVHELTPEPIYVVKLAHSQYIHASQSDLGGAGADVGLGDLQRWYSAHCNGNWEHDFGIRIETLDNPGWSVEIQLAETDLADVTFDEINQSQSDREWMVCRIRDKVFEGRGGPHMLGAIVRTFLQWATVTSRRIS
jgi:hypothetical protein